MFGRIFKQKVLSALMTMILVVSLNIIAFAQERDFTKDITPNDIVVLYENDVHSSVDGYPILQQIKKDFLEKTPNVAVVSAGDFIQGATIATISKGESIIKIMNKLGYDAVTLGNHEFDYTIPQLKKLVAELNAPVVASNFFFKGKLVYEPYIIKDYNGKKIAFLGIATPESITKSTPKYFQDKKGRYIFDFAGDESGKKLYNTVQKAVDSAKKDGADIVIALGHLGNEGVTKQWSSTAVIENTKNIDAFLDGHSHSTFPMIVVLNKEDKPVVSSSTGSRFANVGYLVIDKNGNMKTNLISLKDYKEEDKEVKEVVDSIKAEAKEILDEVIAKTDVTLTTKENGKRVIRKQETNLGDFVADSIKDYLDTDIALMNGGGIRADLKKGNITMNDLLTVFPWGNMLCAVEVKGSVIRDALEMGARLYPEENGGFLQVSGLKYTIDPNVTSSVQTDDKGMFKGITGDYRVKDIMVFNKKANKYEPLNLNKNYSVGGINYTIRLSGDGYSMFSGAKVLKDDVAVDVDALTQYIKNNLNGVVGEKYANPQNRITILK